MPAWFSGRECVILSLSRTICAISKETSHSNTMLELKNVFSVAQVSARLELGSSADSLVWSGPADPYTV